MACHAAATPHAMRHKAVSSALPARWACRPPVSVCVRVHRLREMKRCCADDGEILLLEHGVSSWSVLKWWQQHRLNRHVVRWGCYWNRDILELVEQSGLHVRAVERRHLGTTYYLRCSPTPG